MQASLTPLIFQESEMLRLLTFLAACALCQAAGAQAIYKCTVNGKVEYGDRPCASGQTVELAVPVAPSVAPAHAQAQRERATLAQLEKLRLAREIAQEREQARDRRALATQRQRCNRLRLQRRWADEDLARASGARMEAAKIKARRQAEALAVECPA
jgi:hypothetical protein